MYKIFFLITTISLFFFIKIFSQNESVNTNKELIKLIKKETGGSSFVFRNKIDKDIGNVNFNYLNKGLYAMFEGTEGEKTLNLMEDNSVKFTYPLNEKITVVEIGFWKSNDEGDIELVIFGNQFGSYDDVRNFIFKVDFDNKKIISSNYEKMIYGDGGLVFYRK